jgi:hypothetical protein
MANQGIRRLPIIQEGKVVGIVTVTDLARYLRTILLLEGALSPNKTRGFWSANINVDADDDNHDNNKDKERDDEGGNDNGSYDDNTNAVTTATASNTSASPNSIS